ncbi:MAG: CdaR family protein [Lachnoclostridium sp.]|nr:CdaR family protein [Lachnospira sp.]MCM1249282.1 CdaR family protein [Lachnoclostridium sp.]
MRKKLLHNWGLKLASLVLAFVLWFLVVQSDNPKKTATFNNIPVKLTNTQLLENENKVYEVLDNTDVVRVTVCAPRKTIEKLRSTDIVAEADLNKLTDINTIAIRYYISSAEIDSTTIDYYKGNHEVVRLNIEDKATRSIALKPNIAGTPADGYMVGNISLDQNIIEVSGPQSVIETLAEARVDINVANATNNLSANIEIQLYDKEGNVVKQDNIKRHVDYAHISVEVLAVKSVPVEVLYSGTVEDDYMVTGVVESDPPSVQIAGTMANIAKVTQITVPEEAISVEGATENVVTTVDIRDYLPDNVRLADSRFNGKVTATVYVEAVQEKTLQIPAENLSVSNVPEGYQALLLDGTETYELKVKGLREQLTRLNANTLRGIIDVQQWMRSEGLTRLTLGDHYMPVTFTFEDGIEETEPILIAVTIQENEE